tara:strand:+ start:497 stop:832 length:336 start_codon:yes stop_codon:yes gene_type:complete
MRLHSTKYKKNYINYILGMNETTPQELKERFHSEYGFQILNMGLYKACEEWLQGLALNIPYWNDEIVPFAIEMGSLDKDCTEKEEQTVIDNYWSFMAQRTIEAMESKLGAK